MSIFGSIVDKIVQAASSIIPGAHAAEPTAAGSPPAASATAPAGGAPSLQTVDVGAVLGKLAEQKGGGLNWQTSIVDLLKLLDLDSSLDARKKLAEELNVHAGADGTAEQNIALHKAVVAKLAENGGKWPGA